MSISEPFIRRPVATTLLTIALFLAGVLGYLSLPVSPLPQVEFPTISVSAGLPGASPETMASSVATPLERQFGRIAGITEMTSASTLGSTNVTMQFELNKDIDAAAREVQAAINSARGQLPANLPNNPRYQKVNPADAPIMILALQSETYDKTKMYDVASSILQQKIAQINGVGQVNIGGGSLPAVRIEVNPMALNQLGLSLADVRTTVAAANSNRPKGDLHGDTNYTSIGANDQLFRAEDYRGLVITFRDGSPVRIGDVAEVIDSVEDVRNAGSVNGKPAISLVINRQPGANIIATVDRIAAVLPQLQADIPAGMKLSVVLDRTATIRASVHDVQFTLVLSIFLVILVVFAFLRDWRSTIIPGIAVPVSLVGTFAFMYLFGYSLDNLSLMALTIATGFVVDDAIVVVENVSRYLEKGMKPREAALRGAKEIGFTVLSISVSLVAVFIPLLLMGGIVGRLFREFAVTLSVAILVSMVISLTTTPMMCALLLKPHNAEKRGWMYRISERFFQMILRLYERTLLIALQHRFVTLIVLLGTLGLTIYLYVVVPKGFFPQQDTGRLIGNIQADQNASFQTMQSLIVRYAKILGEDPDITGVIAFGGGGGGGGTSNTARMFMTLRPIGERTASADQIIARLRGQLARVPGATLFLQPVQDLRIGGRPSTSLYQYTLQGDDFRELSEWSTRIQARLRQIPGVVDVNSDQQIRGLQAGIVIDRDAAARLGLSTQLIDDALYDAFGQRQISTMYTPLNQYRVVMEVDPKFGTTPDALDLVRVRATSGELIPLRAFARFDAAATGLSVNHQGFFPSITLSFNLTAGKSLGEVVTQVEQASREMQVPESIRGRFSGTAAAFQDSLATQPLLVAAALIAVYIVLGVLYESLIHPITILSTLPSAGVGALLALMAFQIDLNVIALIGIILLIGIVKKNAILMIDFALEAERNHGKNSHDAIYEACVLRFRPILMTTLAALLGGLPLAFGSGTGSELRKPLGIAIVGGLIFSQMLTLYTTPVVYLYLDRLRLWATTRSRAKSADGAQPLPPTAATA